MKKFAKIALVVSVGVAGAAYAYVKKNDPLMNDALKHSVDRRLSVENDSNTKDD